MSAIRTRKAWRVTIQGCDDPIICHAPTVSKARWRAVSLYCEYFPAPESEVLKKTKVVRCKGDDVALPYRHPLAERMPPDLLHMVTHAYGFHSPRHGYREHYYTSASDERMCRLVFEWGMFNEPRRYFGDSGYYTLTALGRRVAEGEVPLYVR